MPRHRREWPGQPVPFTLATFGNRTDFATKASQNTFGPLFEGIDENARNHWDERHEQIRKRHSEALAKVEAKLEERDERHDRMGDTRYVLEPNIKEGKGGLRDLHTLFWIAKYLYRCETIGQLREEGVFSKAELARARGDA